METAADEHDKRACDILARHGFQYHRGFGVAGINALREMLGRDHFELRNPGYDRAVCERARSVGREVKDALGAMGFTTSASVRTWSSDQVEPLKRLPRSSVLLCLSITAGGSASDAAPHVEGFGARVAHVGDHVIVLEVVEDS